MVKKMEQLLRNCGKSFKKTCGWDIVQRLSKDDKDKAQEIFECVMAHWDDYSGQCRDYVRKSVPFMGVVEQDLQAAVDKKKRERGKKKVTIGGVEVAIIAQEGDVIWYEADVRKKKVIDQYEFCPEVEGVGLELISGKPRSSCSYKVVASWRDELLDKLIQTKLIEKISYDGFRGIQGFLDVNPDIKAIIEPYNNLCPSYFHVDVFNNNFNNTQGVLCQRIGMGGGYNCPGNYVWCSYSSVVSLTLLYIWQFLT